MQPCWIYATTGTALATSTLCTASDPGPGNILDLQYNFNLGTEDNGNVVVITNKLNSGRSQTFTYDGLNRIMTGQTQGTAGSNCFGLQFSYDAWANLTAASILAGYSTCTDTIGYAFDPPTINVDNQITSSGFTYDGAGNVLSDGMNNYAWNADSEVKSAAQQQKLTNAQDAARHNPNLAPHGGKTFCNIATCQIAKTMGAPMGALTNPKNGQPALANQIATNLAKSGSGYTQVSPQEAQRLANQGQLVIAVQPHFGHGHVATVRPGGNGSNPLINNIGARVNVVPASKAFLPSPQVKYYTPQ